MPEQPGLPDVGWRDTAPVDGELPFTPLVQIARVFPFGSAVITLAMLSGAATAGLEAGAATRVPPTGA